MMSRLRTVGLAVATVGLSVPFLSACATNTAESVSEAEAAQPAGGATDHEFGVGEFVKLGDYTIKVNKVANPYRSKDSWNQPDKGKKFVTVDVSVKNNGEEPAAVSSLMCFTLRDADGQAADIALITGIPRSPDGEVAPGKFIKGTLGYEVPKNAKGLTLEFKCDLLSSGTAYVSLD